jgi:alpha-tubulin suppressor-like RCC1 family protein/regulation of enolase protein 1 (concanavalin A-like superfamily)
LAGASSYNAANDTFTVKGAGADIWGTADQFEFVYQAISGNCELVARVVTLQNTNGWAKAGVMIREDLTAGGKNALVAATVSNGVTYQWRYTTGAGSGSATGGSGVAPVWVKLKRLGDQVTYYRSADGQTWSQIGSQNIAMNSTVYAGLAVTSHNAGALATATFDHVSLTASGTGTLPSPWNDADIGAVGYHGYAVFDGTSTYSVAGGGADIWGTADAFHFLYQPLVGDGAVQARILTQQNTNSWAKAGGMIRESLDPGSEHGMSILSSSYGMLYQGRNTTGGTSIGLPTLSATTPVWTKAERRGPVIIGWKSLDGVTWDWVGSQPVSMGTQTYAGLAVTAHNNGALSLATFDNLQVTAGRANSLPSPWNEQMLGSPVLGGWAQFANNTFSLYAGGGDIWNAADQGEFVYRPLNGDGTITLQVANLKNSQEWAKAGIMMRETLSPDARHVLWGVSPTHGVFLQKRVTTGTTPSNYYDGATVAPVWLKLERKGNVFTASKSSDGVTWTVFGAETVPMDANIYAGAVLSSPNTTVIGQTDIPALTMTVPSAHSYAPVAWWPMDEGSGTTLVDASGGQHDATVSGIMVRTAGHNASGGINLPSGDATGYVTTQTLMSGTSSLSVSAWFKTTDSGVRRIISKGHWGASTGFLLGIGHSAPGRLTFGIGGGTADQSILLSTTESFNDGAWHHVLGVYDSAARTARIYVDGTLRNVALTGSIWGGTIIENGKALDTTALTQLSTTSNIALHIGSYNGQYERWLGELDDIRIYAAALDAVDDQSLYTDSDSDGMPDSWEQRIVNFSTTDNITSASKVLPGDDFDHDGITNLQEYQQGSDPTDYYNGHLPNLTVVSGSGQWASSGALVGNPVIIQVRDGSGMPLANAPLQILAQSSGAGVSASAGGAIAGSIAVSTGPDGMAAIYPAPSGAKGSQSIFQVKATSAGQTTTAGFSALVAPDASGVQISAGAGHAIVLKSDGTVWAWGANYLGQLGANTPIDPRTLTMTPSSVPVQVGGLPNIKKIATGLYHNLALDASGQVWAWGGEYDGELGDGGPSTAGTNEYPLPEAHIQPCRINGLNETSDNQVIQIAAGAYFSLALKQDHTVWEWGTGLAQNEAAHLAATQVLKADGTPLAGITKIAAGNSFAMALDSDGHIWAWGLNSSGELGDQSTTSTATAVEVMSNGTPLAGVTDIQCGSGFSMALMSDGSIMEWGQNVLGGLGDGVTTSSNQPIAVSGFGPGNPAVAIHAAWDYSMAISADHRVWVWGENYSGQLGGGTVWSIQTGWVTPAPANIPTEVAGLNDVVAVGGMQWNCYAVDTKGRVWSWGQNVYDALGQELPKPATSPAMILTDESGASLGGLRSISAGTSMGAAILQDWSPWVWGWNGGGALGDGSWVNASQPFRLTSLQNIRQVSAAPNASFSVFLDWSGKVWQTGKHCKSDDSFELWSTPTAVPEGSGQLGNIQEISAGDASTLAVTPQGDVWAWGENGGGEVGNGTQTPAASAVQIATDNTGAAFGGVADVSEGGFSLARKSNGEVWAWGSNYYGQLGRGSAYNHDAVTRPVKVALGGTAIAVSAGETHALALDYQGRVWSWGDNSNGKLGNGITAPFSDTPVVVTGLPTAGDGSNKQVISILAGDTYSLALMSDGTVYGWGKLTSLAGMSSPQTTPVQLPGVDGVAVFSGARDAYAHLLGHFDGSLAAWGVNTNGEVGTGGVTIQPTAYPISGFNLLVVSPTATLVATPSGTVAPGTPVSLAVTGTSSTGATIARVDYYNEGEWIGALTDGSTTWSWTPPTWGDYHLRAVVTDSTGLTSAYSNTITLHVPDVFKDSDGDGVSDAQEAIDGTDPNDASSVTQRRIAYFPFDDASFKGAEGETPKMQAGESLPDLVPGFSGTAIHVDRMGQLVRYNWMRTDGSPNYAIRQGTVSMWFKLDWTPAHNAMSGSWSILMRLGMFGMAEATLHFDYTDPILHFFRNDGVWRTFETLSPFSGNGITKGTWHQVVVTYSSASQRIYLDGNPISGTTSDNNGVAVADGAANWNYPPKLDDFWKMGLMFGSDSGQPLKGAVDEIQIFNYRKSDSEIQSDYNTAWTDYQTRTGAANTTDSDSDGLTDAQEAAAGTDPHVADNPALNLNVMVFVK